MARSDREKILARNEVGSCHKVKKNCNFDGPRAILTQMRFDRQTLRNNCDFGASAATLTLEMRFDRQKLRENCAVERPLRTK